MARWKLVLLALTVDILLGVILNIIAGETPLQDLFWDHSWIGVVILAAHIWLALRLSAQDRPVLVDASSRSVVNQNELSAKQGAFPWWGWLCGFLILLPLDLIPDVFVGAGQLDDGGYFIGLCIACWKCIKCWLARWF